MKLVGSVLVATAVALTGCGDSHSKKNEGAALLPDVSAESQPVATKGNAESSTPAQKSPETAETKAASQSTPAASTASESTTATAEAPAGLVVRVPVDGNGTEYMERAETRQLSATTGNPEDAFKTGTTVVVSNTALDDDVASAYRHRRRVLTGDRWFWYWRTPWYPGKLAGRGLWWGLNPWVEYGDQSYSYQYDRSHYAGGWNYYVYVRVNTY